MEEVMQHLENNYLQYDIDTYFSILDLTPEFCNWLCINKPIFTNQLPKKLQENTIYVFSTFDNHHTIFHIKDGLIFNPSIREFSFSSEYDFSDVTDKNIEPSSHQYERFWDFIGESRNKSGVMNCLDHESNCEIWCLLYAFLFSKGLTIDDFLDYSSKNGHFKNEDWNKIYYLSFFVTYLAIKRDEII